MAETRRPTMPKGPMRGRGMPVPKGAIKKGTLGRLIKTVFKYYKARMIVALIFLAFSSVGGLVSTVYMKGIVSDVLLPALAIDPLTGLKVGLTEALQARLIELVIMMISVYALVIVSSFFYTRIMATVPLILLKTTAERPEYPLKLQLMR